MQPKVQRKDSKLKRAVTFFKHLGLKSYSRHKISKSSSAYETNSFDSWLAKRRRFEMEDTSYVTSTRAELADSSSHAHGRASYSEKKTELVYEMDGTTLHTSQDMDYLPRYTQEAGTAVQPCELDVHLLVGEPRFKGAAANPANPLTGIGAQFDAARHDVEPWEEMLVSPVSIIPGSFNYQSAGLDTSLPAEFGSVNPTYSDSNTVPSFESVEHDSFQGNVTPAHNKSLPSSENYGTLCDGVTLSTHLQVEELREMVRVLNEEWMRRCQSTPDIVLRASKLSPRSLFDTGAQTLQLVFQGVLPRTFDAVFALAHVACGAAYLAHGEDGSHCWNEFFQDVLSWQSLMLNESDARLFIQLVNLLWWPQGSSAISSCGNYFLDETSGTLVPLRRPVVGLERLGTNDMQPPRRPTKPASMSTLNSLKDGVVLQECSRFLDGVEYAGILERSRKYPTHLPWYAQNHLTNIEEILKTIILPLQHCDGIEALHDTISYTAMELSNGSLRSVREVEVSLISNGKPSCLSTQIYKRYLDTIASICDHIMHEAGPNWRDRCYATDLDTVLASVVEMDNRQRLEHIVPRHRRDTNVNAMPGIKQTWAESVPTPSSIENQTLIGSSPSTVASPTFTTGYSPASQPSSTTSPESSFSAQSPSLPRTEVTHCPLCPALFTGSARDRTSNLRRHMRTSRDHGNAVGLLCTMPGCGANLSRSDNLGKHIRTLHQGDTGTRLRRQGARIRRRGGYSAG
ncbi:hypothetical protein HO173_009615 [Letharia columbiana]|uniref:C2H2-type domain-containing protein n=1 Tax=Letharia columbiana TaxID=112416 RepID=A0A8H6L1P1_9LECA|nr:uncharacterized protein HO173_009615 [Letharia columbiana]KAF6232232.1 hypothetical protein HO173_009615 [Letharia columbiana]